jgi:sulfur-carrier protein adenylyltransferase/sulfurtransferase
VDLKQRIERGDDLQLIDVREEWEWKLGRIPGAQLMPLSRFPEEAESLDRDREVVLYCKVGARSLRAAEYLADLGYSKVGNLSGGILRWGDDVDPSVPRY